MGTCELSVGRRHGKGKQVLVRHTKGRLDRDVGSIRLVDYQAVEATFRIVFGQLGVEREL
jgi:hypothetical protein